MNIDLKLQNKLHGPMHYKIGDTCLLYTNIDLKLRNKLHGPMHYKIGVKCLFNDLRYILCSNNIKLLSTSFEIDQTM